MILSIFFCVLFAEIECFDEDIYYVYLLLEIIKVCVFMYLGQLFCIYARYKVCDLPSHASDVTFCREEIKSAEIQSTKTHFALRFW